MSCCVLATASDGRYFPGLMVTLVSACAHSPELRVSSAEFHVLDGGISEDAWNLLRRELHSWNPDLRLVRHTLELPDWKSAPRIWGGSLMAYARFWLPEMIRAPQVVYIDSDFLVQKDLVKLYQMPFEHGVWTYACQDLAVRHLRYDCDWLTDQGLEDSDAFYFNSGLLKIDLDAWREARVFERAIRIVSEEPQKCRWYDQTVLNYLLKGHWGMLNQTWNLSIYACYRYRDDEILNANLHFVSARKPWNTYSREFGFRCWHAFLRARAWPRVHHLTGRDKVYWRSCYRYWKSELLEASSLARTCLVAYYRILRKVCVRARRRTEYAFQHWSHYDPLKKRALRLSPQRERRLVAAMKSRWTNENL